MNWHSTFCSTPRFCSPWERTSVGWGPHSLVIFGLLLLGGLEHLAARGEVVAGEARDSSNLSGDDAGRTESLNQSLDQLLDPAGVRGKLLLVGGGRIPDSVWQRFQQLSGDSPRLVVIPTAAGNASAELSESERARWRARGFPEVEVLHLEAALDPESDPGVGRIGERREKEPQPPEQRNPQNSKNHENPQNSHGGDEWSQVAQLLAEADAVWIGGGQQARVTQRYLGTVVEQQLRAFLDRGGVIGGTSAGAAVMSGVMIAGGNPRPRLVEGFDWLPDAIVDQHFSERNRQGRLEAALRQHPDRWGIGIDEGTAVVVRARRIEVLGEGSVTMMLAGLESGDPEIERLEAGEVADLTAWRRAARGRGLGAFPPEQLDDCQLTQGALVIVGGGELPRSVVSRFVELAGGPDARIVVLPTALPDPLPDDRRLAAPLTRAGARNVRVLRERDPRRVNEEAFVAELHEATGVWFGGGRQWRFVDAYDGTRAQEALRQLLARGGVIGGSSAGASIQAEYLVRGSPLGNHIMMARGYERGLGYLPGTAIDQHFTQRNRLGDLAGVIRRHPQLLGIGVDEGTALVVQGSLGEVLGRGAVYFFDSPDRMATSVTAGGKYDLKARRLAVDAQSDPGEITEEEGP